MQLPELLHALRHLGLGGIATSLEARLVQAQADHSAYADFLALLLQDELTRRADRLLTRRLKEAQFRDPDKTLDGFDFAFNKKMDRHLVFELATGRFLTQREDVVFLGPPGTGKSHLAQALGHALIQLQIPTEAERAFRLKPNTDSEGSRTPVPTESEQ